MNKNQENFLNELSALLDKYDIDKMESGSVDYVPIVFHSNDKALSVMSYHDGLYERIITKNESYKPKEI